MWYKCSFLHDKVAVQQIVDFSDLLFNSIFWEVIVLILLYFKKWAGLQFLISKLETQEYVQNSQKSYWQELVLQILHLTGQVL